MTLRGRPAGLSVAMSPFQFACLLFSSVLPTSLTGVTRYDQTQTGDYNVHLDLKNIEVLAFLDGSTFGLGDYEYDYGEMTLKPTTNSSMSIFGKPTTNTTEMMQTTSTESLSSTSTSSTSTTSSSPVRDVSTDGTTETIGAESTTKPIRRCGAGFYRDPAGRCRRLRRPIKISGLLQQAKNKLTSG